MPRRFYKEAARGLDCVYHFDLSEGGGGKWEVVIKHDEMHVLEGFHSPANITITISAKDYIEMVNGKLNGQMAFMTGKLRIVGEMRLGLILQALLLGPAEPRELQQEPAKCAKYLPRRNPDDCPGCQSLAALSDLNLLLRRLLVVET
jgi:putative sterol carrier protein